MNVFLPADILLPKTKNMQTWAVIACDQFTSDSDYWERVKKTVGSDPSTLNLILPEAMLGTPDEHDRIEKINETMRRYLDEDFFTKYPNSYIYVERTLENGSIRKGLVGMVDLEAYSFEKGSVSDIRATEMTVVDRLPPRKRVRRNACLELPHVLLLCDDRQRVLIEPISARKNDLKKIYDFDLMEQGGHITGWLLSETETRAFDARLTKYSADIGAQYPDVKGTPMVFVVGDGNHSLATAKACYEELKKNNPGVDFSKHPARYALVELENIHDESLIFEPINRVITKTDPHRLLTALKETASADEGFEIHWYSGKDSGTLFLDRRKGELAIAVLQNFLDAYLADHPGEVDYIHDQDALIALSSQENAIGFELPAIEKSQLFRGVIADGALPRKTFSMGHAREKRYYLEARKIR